MDKYDGSYVGEIVKQSSEQDEKAGQLIKEWQYLYGLRGNWNNHWTEIAQRILPMDSWLFQNFQMLTSQGDKRNFEIYDSTGMVALRSFGAILDSLLTPRDQFWHVLRASDPVIQKDKASRIWLEQVNNILFQERYKATANFAANNQSQYVSLGAYGTGVQFIDELYGIKGLRYRNVHLSECYIQQNHQGLIDRNCRHFMLTSRQAYLQFGDSCPEQIKSKMERFPEEPFYFLHWVMPRKDIDVGRKDYKGMEFESVYVSIIGERIVKEEGYRIFPYAISRYYQATNETYGRSIAMDVLPALKTLNEQKKTMLKQGHRTVDPVLLAHDDGIIDAFSLEPGSVNAGGISEDGRVLVQPLPVGNVQAGKELMEIEQELIKDSFLVNLFQILTENPQQTATEVLERTREKGYLMAPTIGRQNSEYLGPTIHRELDVLLSQGLLPPAPRLIASSKLDTKDLFKIDFDSPITRSQKAEWASGAARAIQMLTEYAQATQDMSALDFVNMDVAGPQIGAIYGMPDSWIRDPKDIAKIRDARAKQQQMQQNIQAAPAVAGLAKALPQGQQ